MRLPLCLFSIAVLIGAGCSSRPKPATLPSYSGAVTASAEGRRQVAESRGKIQSAKTNVEAAQLDASTLFQRAPVDLRPLVESLQKKLTLAIVDLDEANTRAAAAESALVINEMLLKAADSKAKGMQDALFAAESKVVEKDRAIERLNAERNDWRNSSLKWMALFWGGMAGVTLFFFRGPIFFFARKLIGLP